MSKLRNNNQELPKLVFDKKRFRVKHCPCGKENKDGKFVPYVGYENKGYCHSCGKTFLPELSNSSSKQPIQINKPVSKSKLPIIFIPYETFKKQLENGKHLYDQNNFIKWLGDKKRGEFAFDNLTITKIIEKYFLLNSGNAKYKAWALFPYVDINSCVRDIKAMAYCAETGKRIKEPKQIFYIGKEILNNYTANIILCFFGEHLLKGNNKAVKIFESEATAVYASVFFPNHVCLATGGKFGVRWKDREVSRVLEGREVTLYPDLDAYKDWIEVANVLNGFGLNVMVSNLIKTSALKYAQDYNIPFEQLVKEKYDLRDILKHKRLSDFINPIAPNQTPD